MIREKSAMHLASIIVSAILAGCASGPDFKRPDPPDINRYTANALKSETSKVAKDETAQQIVLGERLDQKWWQLFHSNALNDVVKRSLEKNNTIAAARFTLTQTEELAAAKSGSLYPQVNMTAGMGRQKYGAEFFGDQTKMPPFTYFAIGPTVSYTFDFSHGTARSVEHQRALADYQRTQLNAAYLAVTGNAVMQSLKIASLRAQIATVQTLLAEDREDLKLVQTAFAAGAVSRLDIVSAESQLASDAALLPPLRQELSVAQHALAIILGQAPAESPSFAFDLAGLILPIHLPVSLPSQLVRQRPDILAAEAELHAATAAVGIATANLYPKISLSAAFSQQSTDLGQLFSRSNNAWSLISGLVAPLFDGGTLRAEQRASIAAMHASAMNYQQIVLNAFGQVADALQALDHDADALNAQTNARRAAEENLDLTRKSYREGNVGVLQVLDAERRFQQTSLAYVKAQAQRYIDTAQLFLALGGSVPNNESPDGELN